MIKEVVLDVNLDTLDEGVEVILTFRHDDGSPDNSWNFYHCLSDGDELCSLSDCDDVWDLAAEIAACAGVVCHGSLSSTYDISIDDYDIVIDELGKLNEKYHTEITNDILKEQIYGDEE